MLVGCPVGVYLHRQHGLLNRGKCKGRCLENFHIPQNLAIYVVGAQIVYPRSYLFSVSQFHLEENGHIAKLPNELLSAFIKEPGLLLTFARSSL